jgi:NAD-dependent dihydropyrimidine dehydrogenase PreA subunit
MKKMTSIKYIIALSSLILVIGIGVVLACADGGYDDGDVTSFFSPEVIKKDQFKPFFRSIRNYYGIDYRSDNNSDFTQVNVDEWYMFFSKFVKKNDLYFLLYKSRISEIDSLSSYLQNNKLLLETNLKNNSILIIANKALLKEFFDYLSFAKQCEPYATYNSFWYWKENEKNFNPKKNISSVNALITEGNKLKTNIKSKYIQQRYFFQIQRLFFLKGDFNASYNYYLSYSESYYNTSTIKYRAMSYSAGALLRLKKYSEANYTYSLVYDKCNELKIPVYESFYVPDDSVWIQTLALAKNNYEKTVLWHIFGLRFDLVRAMKEIYSIDPGSILIEPLLVRSINIIEEQILPQTLSLNSGSKNEFIFKLTSQQKELYEFVINVAQADSTSNSYLWNLAAGYLSVLSKKFQVADDYLLKANNENVADNLLSEQIKLVSIVSKIQQFDRPTDVNEAELVKDLEWIKNSKHQKELRNNQAFRWALSLLSKKYLIYGDSIKSQCLEIHPTYDFYLSNNKMNQLISFFDKPVKTDFDKFLLEQHKYTKAELIELQAIRLVYQGQFIDALSKFNECEGSGNTHLLGDPFLIHLNDCHDCDHQNSKGMTKKEFVIKMIEYEKKSKLDPKNSSEYYFKMANGLYNIHYFGNGRYMYQTRIKTYSIFDFSYDKMTQFDFIFDCKSAENMYLKAMNASTDKNMKALCVFMAAKCEQNVFFLNKPKEYIGDFKAGKYFSMLLNDYSTTTEYSNIIRECGYFKTYANKNQ